MPLKVAIVGGGSVGLTFAVHLVQLEKCDVHLFEGAAAFTEIGAGIDVAPNAIKAYQEMGFADEIYSLASPQDDDRENLYFETTYGDGRNGLESFVDIMTPIRSAKCHRADLLNLLVSKLPTENVHLRKSLSAYSDLPEGGVRLQFRDGTSYDADVLVGADGIKSTVRWVMYADQPEFGEATWSGTYAYRALLPIEKLTVPALGEHRGRLPTFYVGQNKHIVQFPVSLGTQMNLVCFFTPSSPSSSSAFSIRHPPYPSKTGEWITPSTPSELLADFADFHPRVLDMLSKVGEIKRWAIFECPLLPTFVRGRAVLLGDAAHASTPHGGNGASQGMEDALTLARLLSHPLTTRITLEKALAAYDAARRPRTQRWQEAAWETGKVYECCSALGDGEEGLREELRRRMDWVWGVDVKAELGKALRMFEESVERVRG